MAKKFEAAMSLAKRGVKALNSVMSSRGMMWGPMKSDLISSDVSTCRGKGKRREEEEKE